MDVKTFRARIGLKEGPAGSVRALFSVFNTIDQSRDVVLPSFFEDGQDIPMAAWGHDWGSLPPGRGVVKVTPEGAVFEGRFFMQTPQGQAHYETIKEMHDLQEWSFGFSVLEEENGTFQGQRVRFLKRGTIFEASPVLIGDNRETRTLSIKQRQAGRGQATVTAQDVLIAELHANGLDVPYSKGSPFYDHQGELRGMLREARSLGVRV